MSSTTFVNGTVVQPSWLNDVNASVYNKYPSAEAYGAVGNGVTNDTVAIQAAITATGGVYLTPGKTYITGSIIPPANGTMYLISNGVGGTLKLAAGTNDHLIKNLTNATVWSSMVNFDGNRTQNNTGIVNPAVVFNQQGSLIMFGGTVQNGVHDQILSGNVDYNFNGTTFAQLVYLQGVTVVGGTASTLSGDGQPPQDCYRIFRTKTVKLLDCSSVGGLSGARIGYYCDDVSVIGGHYQDSYGDVGVTVYFTTRFVVQGITSTGHFQHGIEIDAASNGVVSGNVCKDNARNGILLTEYGPATASATFVGTYDGITTSYPNVYPNRAVLISDNVCRANGLSGIKLIGQNSGTVVKGNTLDSNNTTNDVNEFVGIYISAGTLGTDNVTLGQNTFINSGNQTWSVSQSSVQYTTMSEGNTHIGGAGHFQFAVQGPRTDLQRNALFDTSKWTGTASTMVADTSAMPLRSARQVPASGASMVTLAASPSGDKLIVTQVRTFDTLASVTISVDLYNGASLLNNIYNSATALTTSYATLKIRIPDSKSTFNYDRVIVTYTTPAGGKLNIGQLNGYGSTET